MCARFSLVTGSQAFLNLFGAELETDSEPPEYHPTEAVPAVIQQANEHGTQVTRFRWGIIPPWAQDLKKGPINARSETLEEKPTFREALKRRRCLIPATSFYEWDEGDRYEVTVESEPLFAIAGLFEIRKEFQSCTIVTIPSSDLLWDINDRMPLLLSKSGFRSWLDPSTEMEQIREQLWTPPPELKLRMMSKKSKPEGKKSISIAQSSFPFD